MESVETVSHRWPRSAGESLDKSTHNIMDRKVILMYYVNLLCNVNGRMNWNDCNIIEKMTKLVFFQQGFDEARSASGLRWIGYGRLQVRRLRRRWLRRRRLRRRRLWRRRLWRWFVTFPVFDLNPFPYLVIFFSCRLK